MSIFVDSADLNEIKEMVSWGIISGCTTNPAIAAKAVNGKGKYNFKERILEIIDVVRGPVSVELLSLDLKEMLNEAKTYNSWNKEYIIIKVPLTEEGLKAINVLENKEGIKTNATCIMSFNQAYLAALSGATYVSIFAGRIRDMGYDAELVIRDTAEFIKAKNLKSKIITGSIRHLMDVNEAFKSGAHIVTVTPEVLRKMVFNPRTQETIAEFNAKWKEMKEKGMII